MKTLEIMEPHNRLADIFAALGLEQPRPTEERLAAWGMSAKRFMQLYRNRGNLPITVQEARVLRAWLEKHFAGTHVYLFADEMPPHERMQPRQSTLQLQ